jgi:hypothetical protein
LAATWTYSNIYGGPGPETTLPLPEYARSDDDDESDSQRFTPQPPTPRAPRGADSDRFRDAYTKELSTQARLIQDVLAADAQRTSARHGAPLSQPQGQSGWGANLARSLAPAVGQLATGLVQQFLPGGSTTASQIGKTAFAPGWQTSASNAWRAGFGV